MQGNQTRLIASALPRNDARKIGGATLVALSNMCFQTLHYMPLREALALRQATSKESPFHSPVIASEHSERSNQTAKNPQTKKHRITRKSARRAMAKPQHSRALDSAIFSFTIAHRFQSPSHSAQRQCSSRRHNVDACAVDY